MTLVLGRLFIVPSLMFARQVVRRSLSACTYVTDKTMLIYWMSLAIIIDTHRFVVRFQLNRSRQKQFFNANIRSNFINTRQVENSCHCSFIAKQKKALPLSNTKLFMNGKTSKTKMCFRNKCKET